MTASLTVRQQASRQAKRENNEINRWARLADTIWTANDGDGCSTTAAGSAAAAVQTVVGGPHTRCRRGRQRGREASPLEKDVCVCHVSAILDVLSTEPPVCLANEQKRRSEIRRLRSTYWNANLKRETLRQKTEGLAAMMRDC